IDPRVHLNTAVAALMELVNELYAYAEIRGVRPQGLDDEARAAVDRPETAAVLRESVEALLLMLSPYTPHMCEELWAQIGHAEGVVAAGWPVSDEAAAREESIEIPVQVNGKLRGKVMVPSETGEGEVVQAAQKEANVAKYLEGKEITKTIFVQG
ncbi:MAG: class I tRNA ligase family protein, partial [bacterium]|nr:class I tRNA ligase family protein [bacterium]